MSVYLCSEAHGEFKGSPYIQQAFPQAWFPLGGAERSLEALSQTEGRAGRAAWSWGPSWALFPLSQTQLPGTGGSEESEDPFSSGKGLS